MNIRQKIAEAARQPLLRSSLGSLVVQVASIGIVVFSNILLTRWLGDSEFARYAYILSWTQLLTVVAMLGLQDVLLKELGTLLGAQEYGLAVSLARQALRESVLSGCVVAIAIIAVAFAADSTDELWRNRYVLVAAAPTIVGFVYIFQVQGVVRCYGGVVLGLLSEKIVRPLLLCGVVAVCMWRGGVASAFWGAISISICTLIAAAFSTYIVWQKTNLRPHHFYRVLPQKQPIDRRTQLNFWLLAVMGLAFLRIDALLLGKLGYIAQVGVYNVATRFTDLIGFLLQTMTYVLVPSYAVLYNTQRRAELQRLLTRSIRTVFALTIPLWLVVMCFGKWFLGLHSPAFEAGYPLVVLLGTVQLLYAFLGDSNYLLMMCGGSRAAFWCLAASLVLTVGLEWLLIPTYGMLGAGIGRAIGSVTMYLLTAIVLWRKTGIVPSAIGRFWYGEPKDAANENV